MPNGYSILLIISSGLEGANRHGCMTGTIEYIRLTRVFSLSPSLSVSLCLSVSLSLSLSLSLFLSLSLDSGASHETATESCKAELGKEQILTSRNKDTLANVSRGKNLKFSFKIILQTENLAQFRLNAIMSK